MPIDLQVVFPQQLIELSAVRPLPAVSPRTLEVTGLDFRAVDEVQINGVPSPDVVILSPTRLVAQVPRELRESAIESVTVISATLTASAQSLLRFRIGLPMSGTRGILKLLQLFVKTLFTTPGRDVFAPQLGGAALRNIGLTFGRDEGGGLISDLVVAVANTERQIVAIQARDGILPRDERLLSAKVSAAAFRREEGALIVTLELLSQAGRQAIANITL